MSQAAHSNGPGFSTQAVDAPAYDAFVSAHPDATPFHDRRWINAVTRATGHAAHLLGAVSHDGAVQGVLPLHHVRSPLFGAALVSTGFAVGGGVLAHDPMIANALGTHAATLARDSGVGSVELRGGMLPSGAGWNVQADAHVGFVRDLAADDDAQLLAIPRKQRAEVRKALDNAAMSVRVGTDPASRRDHYRIYAESVRNLGTPVFPRALFDAVLDAFGDDADILTVADDQGPVSSVLNLYWRGTVMPFWGGGVARARQNRGNERMYHALMLHARANKGCTRFDFGRSKAGSGPASYKKNWGFTPEPLRYAVWSADPAAARNVNPTSGKYALMVDTWKKLPLPIANLLGPWIARGLG